MKTVYFCNSSKKSKSCALAILVLVISAIGSTTAHAAASYLQTYPQGYQKANAHRRHRGNELDAALI